MTLSYKKLAAFGAAFGLALTLLDSCRAMLLMLVICAGINISREIA